MSPRIRALRGQDIGGGGVAGTGEDSLEAELVEQDGERQSAFASYLFSHLATKDPSHEEIQNGRRGRTAVQCSEIIDLRSTSHDSIFPERRQIKSFSVSRPLLSTTTPTPTLTPSTLASNSVMASSSSSTLTPGLLISATLGSTPSSLAPSPNPSRPTMEAPVRDRGRSRIAGVHRSLSPVRDPSVSNSRGRRPTTEFNLGGRVSSRSSVRGDGDRDEVEDFGRGRRNDNATFATVSEEVEEQRGRERRGRSDSRLRRGMGREVIVSGAGYGHD